MKSCSSLRKEVEVASRDPVGATLVLLNLLEGDARDFAETDLAHPRDHATGLELITHVCVDGLRLARTLLGVDQSLRHAQSPGTSVIYF
jgi:hypothetical protein